MAERERLSEWARDKREEEDASMKLVWQLPEGSVSLSHRWVSLPSFRSEIVNCFLSFSVFCLCPLLTFHISHKSLQFPSITFTLWHIFDPVFLRALAESIKAVARSERPVLLPALSELQDPIKLLIRPFRRLRPPHSSHHSPTKNPKHSLLFLLFFCFALLTHSHS